MYVPPSPTFVPTTHPSRCTRELRGPVAQIGLRAGRPSACCCQIDTGGGGGDCWTRMIAGPDSRRRTAEQMPRRVCTTITSRQWTELNRAEPTSDQRPATGELDRHKPHCSCIRPDREVTRFPRFPPRSSCVRLVCTLSTCCLRSDLGSDVRPGPRRHFLLLCALDAGFWTSRLRDPDSLAPPPPPRNHVVPLLACMHTHRG